VKEAIEKVMSIQRKKAQDSKIGFEVEFVNIRPHEDSARDGQVSPLVSADEDRLMLILLNL